MQVTEQNNFPSDALTEKTSFHITVEQDTVKQEGNTISERLWGQLEELEKVCSLVAETLVQNFFF